MDLWSLTNLLQWGSSGRNRFEQSNTTTLQHHHSAGDSATPPPTDRGLLRVNEKKGAFDRKLLLKCNMVIDYRTFVEDYLKIVEFIDWLKENYPEEATFLNKKH